ncbi:MAG: PhzF family phenazine biosynthesis protein [Burkholderiales bacterium]|nr:PhzF family phenazine biosynthesis protein [Burkholderiales bacterium]
MRKLPFRQVDVFSGVPYRGNPVAVVLQAESLETEEMQRIANWTNLSETTFVLPPEDRRADYRVRIFTPRSELPFAGHPTIGTAHALLEAGFVQPKEGVLIQECGAGLVKLEADQGTISFELPQPSFSRPEASHLQTLEKILGCPPIEPSLLVDVGPRWMVVRLQDAKAVLELKPDLAEMKEQDLALGNTGVVVFGEWEKDRIEVRAFAPAFGVSEDPVCGSGNGCVAAYLRETSQFRGEIHSFQGSVMGREGMIRLSVQADRILVGGKAVTCVSGTLSA